MPSPTTLTEGARSRNGDRAAPPGSAIASVASAVPARAVPNAAIAARLGVEPDWISSRTGVQERRIAAPGESLVDLAARAGATALERAGARAGDVDLLLVATFTHEELLPNAAPLVASRLGAERAGTMDVGAACTGFLSALELACGAVESGRATTALVIGADVVSRLTDYDDRRTAGLFGDGAGAVVVTASPHAAIGPIRLYADAGGAEFVTASHGDRILRMDGRPTFRAAVARLAEVTTEVCADAGLTIADVDLFVYHQANSRILNAVGERLSLPGDRVVDSLAMFGNTSAASIPLALDAALADGRLAAGSTVLLAAFGAGLTWGAGIVEWGGGVER
jgi:3-oxoacyl-[acyl-carrier-protein] synthase III